MDTTQYLTQFFITTNQHWSHQYRPFEYWINQISEERFLSINLYLFFFVGFLSLFDLVGVRCCFFVYSVRIRCARKNAQKTNKLWNWIENKRKNEVGAATKTHSSLRDIMQLCSYVVTLQYSFTYRTLYWVYNYRYVIRSFDQSIFIRRTGRFPNKSNGFQFILFHSHNVSVLNLVLGNWINKGIYLNVRSLM